MASESAGANATTRPCCTRRPQSPSRRRRVRSLHMTVGRQRGVDACKFDSGNAVPLSAFTRVEERRHRAVKPTGPVSSVTVSSIWRRRLRSVKPSRRSSGPSRISRCRPIAGSFRDRGVVQELAVESAAPDPAALVPCTSCSASCTKDLPPAHDSVDAASAGAGALRRSCSPVVILMSSASSGSSC